MDRNRYSMLASDELLVWWGYRLGALTKARYRVAHWRCGNCISICVLEWVIGRSRCLDVTEVGELVDSLLKKEIPYECQTSPLVVLIISLTWQRQVTMSCCIDQLDWWILQELVLYCQRVLFEYDWLKLFT